MTEKDKAVEPDPKVPAKPGKPLTDKELDEVSGGADPFIRIKGPTWAKGSVNTMGYRDVQLQARAARSVVELYQELAGKNDAADLVVRSASASQQAVRH